MSEATGAISLYSTCPPDWSAGVLHAGHEQCAPGHSWVGIRDHFLLHYVCSGHGFVGGDPRELSRGDAFLFAPGEYLSYRAAETDPWFYLWVGFRGLHVAELVRGGILRGKGPVLRMRHAPGIQRSIEEMITTLEKRTPGHLMRVTGLLYLLLGQLSNLRAQPSSGRTQAVELIHEAQTFVLQNFQREIGVRDIVRHIGVDRSHFGRVFREQTGQSLQEFLIETRMIRARRMLEETTYPVHAVAASVGYRSYPSFERRFVARFGESPSRLRARLRNAGDESLPQ